MVKQDKDIKDKIINATIDLIKLHGDTSRITVRDIAARAGVGIGLINYHFQTKDNLINFCSLEMIRFSIDQLMSASADSEMSPMDQLKSLCRGIAEFMVMNPGVARISLLKDLVTASPSDNTSQVINLFVPIAKTIYGKAKSDSDIRLMLHMLVSSVEVAFLRMAVMKDSFGIDLSVTEQRNRFVDNCIATFFAKI